MSDVTYGRWNPDEVRERVLDDTWPQESPGGLVLVKPTLVSGNNSFIYDSGAVGVDDTQYVNIQGVFTSDFENYIIHMRGHDPNQPNSFYLSQFGQDFTSGYKRQVLTVTTQSPSAGQSTTMDLIPGSPGVFDGFKMYVYGPATNRVKSGRVCSVKQTQNASISDSAWTLQTTASIDGFTLVGGSMRYIVSIFGVVS